MKIKAVVSAVIGLLLAYGGYWYAIAFYAEDYLSERLDRLRKSGLDVEYRDFATSGFPYRLELVLSDTSLRLRDGPYRVTASTNEMRVIVMPWRWTHAIFQARNLDFGISSSWADWLNFEAVAQSAEASFSENENGSFRQSLALHGIRSKSSATTIDRISLHVRKLGAASSPMTNELLEPKVAELALELRNTRLPPTRVDARPAQFDEVSAEIEIHGDSWPRLRGLNLEAWRNTGGTLEFTNLFAQSGPSIGVGEGSFSLDPDLRLIGATSLIISDAESFEQALRGTGKSWANRLANVLRLAQSDDGQPVLSVMLANGVAVADGEILLRYGPIIPLS